jgi:hypothetical protein
VFNGLLENHGKNYVGDDPHSKERESLEEIATMKGDTFLSPLVGVTKIPESDEETPIWVTQVLSFRERCGIADSPTRPSTQLTAPITTRSHGYQYHPTGPLNVTMPRPPGACRASGLRDLHITTDLPGYVITDLTLSRDGGHLAGLT